MLSPPPLLSFSPTLTPDGDLAINYRPSEANMEEILTRVRACGLAIRDLATSEADLEDVLRHLTSDKAA